MHKQHPQTAYRKYAILIGTIFENCDKYPFKMCIRDSVNAERCFAITRKEQNIISSHMWPLTFRHVPTCREAVIVCLADKYCAVLESMFQRTRVADTDAAENEW